MQRSRPNDRVLSIACYLRRVGGIDLDGVAVAPGLRGAHRGSSQPRLASGRCTLTFTVVIERRAWGRSWGALWENRSLRILPTRREDRSVYTARQPSDHGNTTPRASAHHHEGSGGRAPGIQAMGSRSPLTEQHAFFNSFIFYMVLEMFGPFSSQRDTLTMRPSTRSLCTYDLLSGPSQSELGAAASLNSASPPVRDLCTAHTRFR